jgi:hypothetical protein
VKKNGANIQYICLVCNTMLAEVENNTIKSFQSCFHFRIERFGEQYYNHRFIAFRKVIAKDGDYFYVLTPN